MDVMLDLETLGNRPGCVILSVGAVEFSEAGLGRTFYREINVKDSVCHGLTMDRSTLDWWEGQSADAQRVLKACERSGHTLDGVLRAFTVFLLEPGVERKQIKIWGNGADFDNAIIAAAYRAVGQQYPIEFWNNRCFRTLKSVVPGGRQMEPKREGTHHNALDDAKHQAVWAIPLLRALNQIGGVSKVDEARK